MRAPNFFIPGTQKAGTTFLYRHMRTHPDVFLPKNKEPHFFNGGGGPVDAATYEAYLRKHFEPVGDEAWVGEATALYLANLAVPARIEQHVGRDVRFIICLRDPVEKAVSLWMHDFRKGRLHGDEPLVYTNAKGLVPSLDRSRFARALCEYVSLFGRDNVKFLFFEDLRADPQGFLDDALEFLGLSRHTGISPERVNPGFDLIDDGIALSPPEDAPRPEGTVRPMLRKSELAALRQRLRDDIWLVSKITGRDLSHWMEADAAAP